MARLVDINVTKIVWLPGDRSVIATITAPKLSTELSTPGTPPVPAGMDITCFVLNSYAVTADPSNTTTESAVCDNAEGTVPTMRKYSGNLPMFRDFAALGVPSATDPTTIFTEGFPQGYIIRRVGKPQETPFAVADVVEIYHFTADTPQISGGTQAGFLKMTVLLLPTGKFTTKAVIAA